MDLKFLTPDDIGQMLNCTRRAAIADMRAAGGWQISERQWRISEEGWLRWVRARETASTSVAKSGGRATHSRNGAARPAARTLKRRDAGALLASASQPIPLTQPRARA